MQALMDRYQQRLQRFVATKCSHTAMDCDDIVQETWIKVWSAIESYDPKRSFSTWIYTIAHRTTIDHARRQQRRPFVQPGPNDVDSSAALEYPIDRDAPHGDDIWSLAAAVLSADGYQALWLRYGEGLSIGQVAEGLDRSTVSIRVILHRARRTLRRHLQPPTP